MSIMWITCPRCRMPYHIARDFVETHRQEYNYFLKLRHIITKDVPTHDTNGQQFKTIIFDCPKCNDQHCVIDKCTNTEDCYGLCRKHLGFCGYCGDKLNPSTEVFCKKHYCQWTDCGHCRVPGEIYCAEHLK